jgi:hypothetical protein
MEYGNKRAFLVESMSYCAENLDDLIGCGIKRRELRKLLFRPGVGDKFIFNMILDQGSDEEFIQWEMSPGNLGAIFPVLRDSYYHFYRSGD